MHALKGEEDGELFTSYSIEGEFVPKLNESKSSRGPSRK